MENPTRTAEYFARRDERIAALKELLSGLFSTDQASNTLEVGCGHGHFLTAYAKAHPNELCVGIDIIMDRLERADRKKNRAAADNLVFVRAEAWEFLEALPAGVTFQKYFILFPDPWPKRRHQKNRILQEAFLTELAKRSGVGALLHFRTDYAPYFTDARLAVQEHPLWHLSDHLLWPFEQETVFQSRADSHQSLIAVHQNVK